ncbi:MAG: hypothetical protein ACRDK7_00955 [Solirubrobacteraceae bacterium]
MRQRETRPARIRVDDATWHAFKASTGDRAIADVLGEMVTRRVQRDEARKAGAGTLDDRELLVALDRATELRDGVEQLIDRIERRVGRRDL